MLRTKLTSDAPIEMLSQRQLNRSLLERQLLLRRSAMSTASALEHLVGMQSQAPKDPFVALWSRLEGFETDCLSQMMLDRTAVRGSLMRGTIHVVISDDYLTMRPVLQEMHERWFATTAEGKQLAFDVLAGAIETGHCLLERETLTSRQLGDRLVDRWPGRSARGMSSAARFYLPLVQTTPRGVWGESQQATWALANQWIGRPLGENTAPEAMVLRYLAAFGPATAADIQAWSRLQGVRSVVAGLRPQLRTFRNEDGQELFDVSGAPFPDPGTFAPVRFLPGFDNVLLSHADRTRIISEDHRKAIGSRNGLFLATYLVDGFVAGTWKVEQTKRQAIVQILPFSSHQSADVQAIEEEGLKLLTFLAPEVDDRDIQWAPAT